MSTVIFLHRQVTVGELDVSSLPRCPERETMLQVLEQESQCLEKPSEEVSISSTVSLRAAPERV